MQVTNVRLSFADETCEIGADVTLFEFDEKVELLQCSPS